MIFASLCAGGSDGDVVNGRTAGCLRRFCEMVHRVHVICARGEFPLGVSPFCKPTLPSGFREGSGDQWQSPIVVAANAPDMTLRGAGLAGTPHLLEPISKAVARPSKICGSHQHESPRSNSVAGYVATYRHPTPPWRISPAPDLSQSATRSTQTGCRRQRRQRRPWLHAHVRSSQSCGQSETLPCKTWRQGQGTTPQITMSPAKDPRHAWELATHGPSAGRGYR